MTGFGLAGTVALVTGAGQGIGRAVACALAGEGVRVAAADRSSDGVQQLAQEYPGILPQVADVTSAEQVEAVVDATEKFLGPIDLLVNVAGVLHTGDVVNFNDDNWQDTFAVNVTGVFHASRAVARRMVPRGSGAIVTVSSNAAGVPRAGMAAYAASKAASTMFTKSLGLELAPYGIRCNVVAPGSTDTPMQRALWTESGPAPVIAGDPATFRAGIPLGRIATPEDIADAVIFLASPRARHITMHDLYVDGGATLRA
ncbi:2,3-dihydro-2,3-dihydroxybenzoate dehydrogenase [Actinoplanes lutulentus]|uniref:2,3-dihydro-2,3-dihydroxybenzoate dehydrogenase n=1 Tax=Actinoplanes lutulentus TaxID=1287878 RepID=A0A327ZEK5_9ACTN|nr:2,3-dihydro-2,3-dihydroxybenzoate dehydrogenase [Actinoplanes lutulentus]MBB2942553.1 2,3-dihydro-2,3-dihydroxybenzoate dehydrogenase [Actinoplanes lutulentus]RAK38134.1 2,3-dihydro-2,3-dihydroxybenzoate dehydrogenase [Actinoplanes lutulentus]